MSECDSSSGGQLGKEEGDDRRGNAKTLAVVSRKNRTTWKQKYSKLSASAMSAPHRGRGRGRPPKFGSHGFTTSSLASTATFTNSQQSLVAKRKRAAAAHANAAAAAAASSVAKSAHRPPYEKYSDEVTVAVAGARRASARNALRHMGDAIKPTRHQLLTKALITKYGNRRSALFKSVRPMKAPSRRATVTTVEMLFHEDRCFYVGDIVSVTDSEDELPYFAQIRGLIVDPYSRRFAVLTWLIPLETVFDSRRFDAEHFVHGVIDEKWYRLEEVEFVQRQPENERYRREWTPRRCAEEQLRRELGERIRELVAIANAEYAALDDER